MGLAHPPSSRRKGALAPGTAGRSSTMGQQIAFALKDSMHRVLVKLVSFLPGLLALLVAVIVLTAIGALLATILRRILISAKFDERFARTQNANVADWSPSHSPTVLIARTAFWACVVLGCIIG